MQVFLSIRPLPRSCQPCHVTRQPGMTLWTIHPGTMRLDVLAWAVDNLTEEECDLYRAAYGQGQTGTPVEDWCIDGPVTGPVPRALRTMAEERRYQASQLVVQRRLEAG